MGEIYPRELGTDVSVLQPGVCAVNTGLTEVRADPLRVAFRYLVLVVKTGSR